MDKNIVKVLHDNFGNTATIEKVMILPYKGARQKELAYILKLTADYEENLLYRLTTHETIADVYKELEKISCNTWK